MKCASRRNIYQERRVFEALRDAAMFLAQHDAMIIEDEIVRLADGDVMWNEPDSSGRVAFKFEDIAGRFERGTVQDLQRYRRHRDRFLSKYALSDAWTNSGCPLFITVRGHPMSRDQYICAVKTLPERQPDLAKLPIECGLPWARFVAIRDFVRWYFHRGGQGDHPPRQHVRP